VIVEGQRTLQEFDGHAAPEPLCCAIGDDYGTGPEDAVIVAAGGGALFRRCMIEEILQGLGPLNEHPTLVESMFNDRSRHTKFTRFDRTILNMLYDDRIKNGATINTVQRVLPAVLADAKRR